MSYLNRVNKMHTEGAFRSYAAYDEVYEMIWHLELQLGDRVEKMTEEEGTAEHETRHCARDCKRKRP